MIEWATFTVSVPYPSAQLIWQLFLWWALGAVVMLCDFTARSITAPNGSKTARVRANFGDTSFYGWTVAMIVCIWPVLAYLRIRSLA